MKRQLRNSKVLKNIILIPTLMFLIIPAYAQEAPRQDPKLGLAMQLLNERTGQVIELAAQLQTLQEQMRALQMENVKLKAEAAKK